MTRNGLISLRSLGKEGRFGGFWKVFGRFFAKVFIFRIYDELSWQPEDQVDALGGVDGEGGDLEGDEARRGRLKSADPLDSAVRMHGSARLQGAVSLPEIVVQPNTSGSFHSLDGLLDKSEGGGGGGGEGDEVHVAESHRQHPRNHHHHQRSSEEMLQFLVRQLQEKVAQKEGEVKRAQEANRQLEAEGREEVAKLEAHLKAVEARSKELTERNEALYQRLKSTEEAKMQSEMKAAKSLDEKRAARTLAAEKDRRLADLEARLAAKSKELADLLEKVATERAEWSVFQADLLTTVRVANDFKQEQAAECKRLQADRLDLEERLRVAEGELAKVRSENRKLQMALRSAAVAAAAVASVSSSSSSSSSSSAGAGSSSAAAASTVAVDSGEGVY